MKLRIMAFLPLILLVFLPHKAGATLLPSDLPTFTDIHVDTTVGLAGNIYTYQYGVTNPGTNTGTVNFISIDISQLMGGMVLSAEGLIIDMGGGGERLLIPFDQYFKLEEQYGHSVTPTVPVGVGIPFLPWMGGITTFGKVLWGPGSFTNMILPGTTVSGFQMTSLGLPTIREIRIDPYFIGPGNVEETEYTEEDLADLKVLEDSIAFLTKTLGPTAPPAIFDALAFITTIRGYITESQTLNWLTDPDLAVALNNHLDATVANINTGDIAAAKTALQDFISALPAPPSGTPACTSECSGLLVFNAQYLLDQLATKPDLRVTKLTLSRTTVNPGERVDVDVTVRNQGGGTASSTTVRLRRGELDFRPITLPELSSGETKTVTGQVILPDTFSPGPHSLIACVDPEAFIDELSETNNCMETFLTIITDMKPDMVITMVSSPPATTYSGGGFSVTDTTANEGFATASTTATRYYLSLDAVKSDDDILLIGAREILPLEAQATMPGTQNVTLPESAIGGPYFILACADDISVVTERNETNNCTASSEKTMVSSEKRSDLQISLVSEPPPHLLRGRSFSVTDTVINQGAEGSPVTGTSTTYYYFSTDRVYDLSDILLLGSRLVNPLSVGESASATATVTVPTTAIQGVYFLLACADVGNTVLERNEVNNCLASLGTTRYITTDLPDLLMTSISNPPGVIGPGGLFSATDTVFNAGASGAGLFEVNYYFSTDRVKGPSDILLKEPGTARPARTINGLASRVSNSGMAEVGASIETGRYFLLACANEEKKVVEGNETNNCIASATTVLVKGPDLVITAIGGVPGKALVGRSFSVTAVVFNQSPTPVRNSTTGYFLSSDPLFDSVDIALDFFPQALLTGFGVLTETRDLIVPGGTRGGSYYLIACADPRNVVNESDETNNCLTATKRVEVEGPDLIVTMGTLPTDLDVSSIQRGEPFLVTDTVRNIGTAAAGASITRYYLGGIDLEGERLVGALAVGETSSGTTTVRIPTRYIPIPLGRYPLRACADVTIRADGAQFLDGGVPETEEGTANNCLTFEGISIDGPPLTTLPDLVTTAVSNFPATVLLGESFSVTDTVVNQGNDTAGESVTIYRLISTSGRAILVFSGSNVPSLAGGESSTGTKKITDRIRDDLGGIISIGTYRIEACADFFIEQTDAGIRFLSLVLESHEGNNCITSDGEIEVVGPDLLVQDVVTGTTTAVAGGTIAVTDTVMNQGTAAAGRFYVSYSLSGLSVFDFRVLPTRVIDGLGVGESITATTEVTVPAGVPTGDYSVIACARGVRDGNIGNECKASGIVFVQGRTVPNHSPVSTIVPVVHCPLEGDCVFPISAADADGDSLSFRFAGQEEAVERERGTFNQPGPPHAPLATEIDELTGIYRWNTRGATLTPDSVNAHNTLYSTQVIVEESDRVNGRKKGEVAIDFFIRLVEPVGHLPTFNTPPTPVCGTTLFKAVGETVSFVVEASDADIGAQVTLNGVGIPSGAAVNPALPVTGNLVRFSVSFVPNPGQAVVMMFSATDENGGQALCPIIVQVGEGGALNLTPLSATNPVGTPHAVTATATRFGIPTSDVTVNFAVSGAHTDAGSCVTNAAGQCAFSYTVTTAGIDTITATATLAGQSLSNTASKKWNPVLTLSPLTATNLIYATHTVTAIIIGAVPPEGRTVNFTVSGSHTLLGFCITDTAGQCAFDYTGTQIGGDTITAEAVVGDVSLFKTVMKKWEAELTLIQEATETMIGNPYTTVVKISGAIPIEGVTVNFTVNGSNSVSGSCVTDATGQCAFTYTGTRTGRDFITVEVVVGGATLTTFGENTWWEPTLLLTPKREFSQVGRFHTVLVEIVDLTLGQRFPNVTVEFTVSGSHSLVASCITDFESQCGFSYPGVTTGVDNIVAKTVMGNLLPTATATVNFWNLILTPETATNPIGTTHTVTALITREAPPILSGTPIFPIPFNDEIANAIPITTIPFSHTIQTELATLSADEPVQSCGSSPNSNSVWYRLTAETNGVITASTFGSSYDTTLSAWTQDLKTELICNDDTAEGPQAEITVSVISGQTIFLQVSDYDPSPNGGLLLFTLTPPSVSDINVDFTVNGANSTFGTCVTNETGQCAFTYKGIQEGTDTIEATAENIFGVPAPGGGGDGGGGFPGVGDPENFLTLNAIATKRWEAIPSLNLSVAKTGTGTGVVTSEPAGIDCGTDCTKKYLTDTVVTLTATPDAGSTFTGWSGDCSGGTSPTSVTMTTDKSCTASFDIFFTLSVTKTGTGAGKVTSTPIGINCGTDCAETYLTGTLVTLTATPDAGSTFTGWSGDPDCADGSVTMNADKTCTARFDIFFTLSVTKTGTGTGVVASQPLGINCGADCTEAYLTGTAVTLTATPTAGSTFIGWSGDPDCNDGSVTMNADKTCTATFNLLPPPGIGTIKATPGTLWPPNHKMVSVSVTVSASDPRDAAPVCKIISVTSNEPENGLGDGDTAPDWKITGNLTVNLRAERSGKGSGRIYTITVACTDKKGNRSTGTVAVTVPHDQGKK